MSSWRREYKVPDALRGRGNRKRRGYGQLSAVRSKFLAPTAPDSQEYLLGELIGIGESNLSMFPEICERLERAKELDWSQDMLAPKDPYTSDVAVVNYGSFEGMYARVVEPWLGKYDQLKATYTRFKRGDIKLDDVPEHIGGSSGSMARRRATRTHERAKRKTKVAMLQLFLGVSLTSLPASTATAPTWPSASAPASSLPTKP